MKQINLSEEKIKEVIDTFCALVSSIKNKDVRDGFEKMLDVIGERLFEAPASNKLEYHNCFTCGLAEHSLRVYGNLKKLRDMFAPELSNDSIILVALCHDLGKVGSLEQPYYVPNNSQWHKENLGVYYNHNEKLDYLAVSQRSLRLINHFNIPLTDDEYKAILICDGQYIQENKSYAHKEGMLGLLAHQADMIACTMEHNKWKSLQ